MPATPYLRIDPAALDRNIARAAEFAAARSMSLRPHAKTHKCLQIAARQMAAGAVGLTVATVGEAEVFASGGFSDVFIAFPLWADDEMGARLRALASSCRLMVGVDSATGARQLGAHVRCDVLIEVDSGMHRSGAAPADVVDVAHAATEAGLTVRGVFTFPGHSYSPTARETSAREEAAALGDAARRLREAGFDIDIVSGGSSPSFAFSDATTLTEARPGVYVTGDAQQWELGAIDPDDIALTCQATVVSLAGGRVVTNAGSKIMGADRPAWATGFGRVLHVPEARIIALSEHHSTLTWPGELPALGTEVSLVPNHACNAINLVDVLHVNDATWPVAARGLV